MKFVVSLLVLSLVAVYSEAQYQLYNNYQLQWPANSLLFRQGSDVVYPASARGCVFGPFHSAVKTITIGTSTVTSTSTSITSCTISTAALSACVSGKRRRRSNAQSSLYYNEEDNVDGIFLPPPK